MTLAKIQKQYQWGSFFILLPTPPYMVYKLTFSLAADNNQFFSLPMGLILFMSRAIPGSKYWHLDVIWFSFFPDYSWDWALCQTAIDCWMVFLHRIFFYSLLLVLLSLVICKTSFLGLYLLHCIPLFPFNLCLFILLLVYV